MKVPGNHKKIRLFIIDNDPAIVTALRNYLQIRFGELLIITGFNSGREALSEIRSNTEIVVLENYLTGENGTNVHHSIKESNHRIQIIRLGTNREIGDAVEIYSNGVARQPQKRRIAKRLFTPVYKAVTYPARVISREFKISEFLGLIMASFFIVGIVVSLVFLFLL